MPSRPRRRTLLVFPHQLFADHPGLADEPTQIYLIEDSLFFGDTEHPASFHKQKLWLHRASMKRYEARLKEAGHKVTYLDHAPGGSSLQQLFEKTLQHTDEDLLVAEVHDFLLQKRLDRFCSLYSKNIESLKTPMFINDGATNRGFRDGKKRWFMADFYKFQRRRLDILMDGDKPTGGEWSYDDQNRKKVPKRMLGEVPDIPFPERDALDLEARNHILAKYPDNPGSLDCLYYPTCHEDSEEWLQQFLTSRFTLFGDYEDAMVEGNNWLWHSVLTPMLNIGLLTPEQILRSALAHSERHDIPLNSLEGFIRQIIGWREFMRATYVDLGVTMRTSNHWKHSRKIPVSFYEGTTGITPIDDVIARVKQTGYCHHIERLMTLGGFMFLCEFDPDEIYRWFMEMFVDSYDWVMVPNVYGMSQHADGGGVATKPYFSGSAYIRKMSNYPGGDWTSIWDGLYWRWILNHADSLAKNPRWAMMCATARRMAPDKKAAHLEAANGFLAQL